MRHPALPALVVATVLAATGTPASAHVQLDEPMRRYDDMKEGPCGRGGAADGRTDRVSAFDPGDTLTVTWTETIDHTGSFRIAFDEDGDDDDDFESEILYDGEDPQNENNKVWSAEVTLPDVECGNCTLQLIQVMTTGEPQDGDLYFQCADLVVGDVPSAPPEVTTGGCAGCSSTPGEALAGALALVLFNRRRARCGPR
jgi:Lytic polysaccharide mono-oxygenase, cellulose-degrading